MISQLFLLPALLQVVYPSASTAHPTINARGSGGIYVADIRIPSIRNDDQYYVVDVNLNGQTLPCLLDTGSDDLFVADDQCNVVNVESGCYLSETYKLGKTKLTSEPFDTVVGVGGVSGNNSVLPVTIGGLKTPNFYTGLIDYADYQELQDGSFSGVLGLGLRNVSRNYYYYQHLPLIDTMITTGLLRNPYYSMTLPRLGDPSSPTTGKLTLGGIQAAVSGQNVTYNDIIDVPNYNYDNNPVAPQVWNTVLQGIRVNGHQVKVNRGDIVPSEGYLSLMDTGAQHMQFRDAEFTAITKFFKGKTIVEEGQAIYFDCSVPQLIELKYSGVWYAVDPLDLIIPSDHGLINGTQMCHAALGTWDRSFADSIIGVPFLRNVVTVFNYVSSNLYTVQPRLGLASITDGAKAVARYPSIYQNRLLSTVVI